MAAEHGPRKMGVYEGAGTTRSQSPTVITAVVVLIVVALIAIWLI